MDYENFGALDASIQEKIDNDADFQETVSALTDEEREEAVKLRKSELLDEEIKTLSLGVKKSKELADNYKIRAEKAEKEAKKVTPEVKAIESKSEDLTVKDAIVISKSNVHEEDIDEVVKYAKYAGLSIQEALKDDVLKTILANRQEKRNTANATSTGRGVRQSTTSKSPSAMLSELSKGVVPEAGTKEAEDVFWARRGGKK
jgi:hypothetical protein